ncbi:MAG: hypothetical protein ACI9CA_000026 [Natronomonas sp.]|jgi:hypothetical protein
MSETRPTDESRSSIDMETLRAAARLGGETLEETVADILNENAQQVDLSAGVEFISAALGGEGREGPPAILADFAIGGPRQSFDGVCQNGMVRVMLKDGGEWTHQTVEVQVSEELSERMDATVKETRA